MNKPLSGIAQEPNGQGAAEITVGIRTGDTPQRDRQRMIKHPPHILIITPESLYLMLTSTGGQTILHTAEALIIDELHALIDTKRGAHLMLSVA
ncbi:DEAD/DEAH box helicase, partial [Thomasclavelia ramosa]|uniref:DEAD/DEAH box helicase n=1 Tax=Thomasclavelia ramosa TaxID=1547 RepID=UPI002223DA4D